MISISNKNHSRLSFDMVSQTNIHIAFENEDYKQNDIDIFINDYIKQNINQGDDAKRWAYTQSYSRSLSNDTINRIVHQYGNDKIANDLVEYYFEIYQHMEFVFEKHIDMIEKEKIENIKRNIVSFVLFNSITYSNFLF